MPKKKHGIAKTPSSDPGEVVWIIEYEITSEPIIEKRFRKLPRDVKDAIKRLHDLAQANPRQAIEELPEWIEKYPDIPSLYNYLSVAYSNTNAYRRAEEVVVENFHRNPDYLFARLNYAELCLGKGDYDRVAEILDHKFDLKLLYPNRKRFHISEFLGFMNVVGRYFAAIGKVDIAKRIYSTMQEIAPDEPETQHLQRELNPNVLQKIARGLLKKASIPGG